MKKDIFFEKMESLGLALAYDDVRLKSGYSKTHPSEASTATFFSRNIKMNCPIVSAAMDTVTEAHMAIAMGKLGGLGIIHKAMTPEAQSSEVRRVKLHLNCLIKKPICVKENDTIEQIEKYRTEQGFGFHSFPVLNDAGKLVGLLTRNDFDLNYHPKTTARNAMTRFNELVTAAPETTPEQARDILKGARKKVLPLLNKKRELIGMYIFSDVMRAISGEKTLYNVDKQGHLVVGAAIGTGTEEISRAHMLAKAGCDVLVIDTAHGDSKNVLDMLKELKSSGLKCDIVVGNISEGESAKRLADAGADGIKVGQGPGSICTTRIVAGIGCPQVTAIYNCSKAIRGSGIPVCADGGIRNSGDITIALGIGADSVMLGKALAGTTETPGQIKETPRGRIKSYRGMGSMAAMQASKAARARYRQDDTVFNKLVAEGVESIVHYQGDVADVLSKQIGGLRSGMGYVGAGSILELQEKADFHRMSGAGLAESHPHDVVIVDDAK